MKESKSQSVRASKCQNKFPLQLWERVRVRGIVFLLLFTVYFSFFTVVTGCGKKAPPKPPQEAAWVK